MNKGFYKDLDTNFTEACDLCEREFTHAELVELLKNGNIPEKQIAALKFDAINSLEDGEILLSNLTGCDGKIREAVALKIYNILKSDNNAQTFLSKESAQTFANATIDINANICRLVVDSVQILKSDEDFAKEYVGLILTYANQALDELDKFIFRDKKYVINKQLFKLYWCLEALKLFPQCVSMEILKRSAQQSEYTVREKAAEIAILSDEFEEIQDMLKNDANYYVKAVLLNH